MPTDLVLAQKILDFVNAECGNSFLTLKDIQSIAKDEPVLAACKYWQFLRLILEEGAVNFGFLNQHIFMRRQYKALLAKIERWDAWGDENLPGYDGAHTYFLGF